MGDKNFRSAEQAFQFQKCLFCEREDACLHIMQADDPKVLSEMGNKIFTKADWESKKVDMLKCVAICKFNQNPELKEKLKATGDTPLYECTRSRYWGTGWKLNAPNWGKSSTFPGKNIFGNILMEICDNTRGSKERKEQKSIGKTQSSQQLGVKPISDIVSIPASKAVPASEAMETDIHTDALAPSTLDGKTVATVDLISSECKVIKTEKKEEVETDRNSDNFSEEGKTAKENSDKIEDTKNLSSHDSISFSSSTYLSGNTSFTRKSVEKADGSLDVNKLMSWILPKLDTSA